MAKTYNTISTFTSGQILTATQMNGIGTNVNNYRVPPMVRCVRSGNLTYTANADVAWNGTDTYDTDDMHDPATNNTRITPTTNGIYLVQFSAFINISGTATAVLPSIRQTASAVVVARQDYFSSVTGLMYINCMGMAQVSSSSDYFTAQIGFSGGTVYTINADATTYFAATWLGQVS